MLLKKLRTRRRTRYLVHNKASQKTDRSSFFVLRAENICIYSICISSRPILHMCVRSFARVRLVHSVGNSVNVSILWVLGPGHPATRTITQFAIADHLTDPLEVSALLAPPASGCVAEPAARDASRVLALHAGLLYCYCSSLPPTSLIIERPQNVLLL